MIAGIDSHKDTLAVSLVDQAGREDAATTFANTAAGHQRLLGWLDEHGPVARVGIEGAGGSGRALALRLDRAGVAVVEVPAALTHRERRRQRAAGKSDPIDALAIARVTLREQDLPPVRPEGFTEDLRLLLDRREQLIGERTRTANRVHADLTVLRPGYQSRCRTLKTQRSLVTARGLVRGDHSLRAELIRERLTELQRLDRKIAELARRIAVMVEASGTTLTQIYGVGQLVAARILAEVGDVRRFPRKAKFAAANGTAPIPASSGRSDRHRLNRGGNRKLNRALHTAALTQASRYEPGRRYVQRKQHEGKSRKEALRCLKRRISDAVYRQLHTDLAAPLDT